ncbi:hypothetical protein BDQ17DRAFT_1332656 [Cyathus striatus]|nr:hypothetical protein BDQ17DRAFT_1332656 [Cyathus striatus]
MPGYLHDSTLMIYDDNNTFPDTKDRLTIARFRGDMVFGLTARIVSMFMGGVVGMVIWYISTGSGHGNPYGLAAIFFSFPFFFYALYWAMHPMINIIFFVTASLVVGYSYQDEHFITPGSLGVGFMVAWALDYVWEWGEDGMQEGRKKGRTWILIIVILKILWHIVLVPLEQSAYRLGHHVSFQIGEYIPAPEDR